MRLLTHSLIHHHKGKLTMDIKTRAEFTFAVNLGFRELEVLAALFNTVTKFRDELEPDGHDEDLLIQRIKCVPKYDLFEMADAIDNAFSNAVDAIDHCDIDEP